MPEQLQFFSSLEFPGRSTLLLWEIAERLGCTGQHLLNEVEAGELVAINIASRQCSRRALRLPVECYRDYILRRLTGPCDMQMRFLRDLPVTTRRQLLVELVRSFPPAAHKGLVRQLQEAVR